MKKIIAIVLVLIISTMSLSGCVEAKANSGAAVAKADKVRLNSDGLTAEQVNIKKRLKEENDPGAVKYFYAISAYNNSYMYATVDGKVTSSTKSLLPKAGDDPFVYGYSENGDSYTTNEILNEDGTYGSSIEYLYFFDPEGNYYQVYPTGGWLFVVRDAPMNLPEGSVSIKMEPTKTAK